ncbi:MAG: aminopeptidase N [Thiohalomonadales bacterium]
MAADLQAQTPPAINRSDYLETDYRVTDIELHFDLHESDTLVKSTLKIELNPCVNRKSAPLILHGQDLQLVSITLDGHRLSSANYSCDDECLTLQHVPEKFVLEIENKIDPLANTSLNGLYQSGGNFCTQCEAEGFRHITYMYDRPDILAKYTTTIRAKKKTCPVLLSNGNLIDSGEDGDSHWATWQDPFPKPTYLFALVAGDLSFIEDKFVTSSGREVALRIYVQHHNIDKCDHAMQSLQRAMKWDEEVYGREYDLDIYMIVAVDDFNMGAMENKGLNVFNSKYVLAKPETATDSDYQGIEGVIGHEYFHNWSGNRVTCRDWFQLSLKEGFTVFRDQEFSADMTSKGVKRISDVNILRTAQFREDAGPMAHPVRPDSYVEINNFYTVTIYNKGAEVVRMLRFLVGAEGFRQGTDLYFDRHDGQAVTTEEFVKAIEDANSIDLELFRNWYSQAGTPQLTISDKYDKKNKLYRLTVNQDCPPTPGQTEKQEFHIPLAIGLLDRDGNDISLSDNPEGSTSHSTRVLHVTRKSQCFEFEGITEKPVPSLLRGFSAPVKIKFELDRTQRCFLMAHDNDDFNRWDAGQQLGVEIAIELIGQYQKKEPLALDEDYISAIGSILQHKSLDNSLAAQAITLPMESYIADFMEVIDPQAVHHVRRYMCKAIAESLETTFLEIYRAYDLSQPYSVDPRSVGARTLKNCCLHYLMSLERPEYNQMCMQQFQQANNMTDVIAALAQLNNVDTEYRQQSLDEFYNKWNSDALVIDKWFSIQAISHLPGTLDRVKQLCEHPAYSIKNPNKVRALLGAFCHGNTLHFHDATGVGYAFLAEKIIELDGLNPQIAARLVSVFGMWRRFDDSRQDLIKQQLNTILTQNNLSKDVTEIVSKSLS